MADLPPKKNDSGGYVFYVSLVSQADTKIFQANPTLAAGDVKIAIDDASPANLGTLPAVDADFTKRVKVTLSQAETNGDVLSIIFSDAAGSEWCDLNVEIQTVTRQIKDLAYPATSGRSMGVEADGHVHADLKEWLGVAPLALSSQRVQAYVVAMAAAATQAIWDKLTSALTTVGSIGKLLVDNINATISSRGAEATLTTMKETTAGGFDRDTDSLQAIRDRGDVAWITGGGGGITDILNIEPMIPNSIDLADTATFRLGLALTNMVDDLPTTGEITPGTITIDRKAVGAVAWTTIVNAAACSEVAGLIYYDEVFDFATGYREGDSIRITFKSAKITVAANDYEIAGTDGLQYFTYIRESPKATFDLS